MTQLEPLRKLIERYSDQGAVAVAISGPHKVWIDYGDRQAPCSTDESEFATKEWADEVRALGGGEIMFQIAEGNYRLSGLVGPCVQSGMSLDFRRS